MHSLQTATTRRTMDDFTRREGRRDSMSQSIVGLLVSFAMLLPLASGFSMMEFGRVILSKPKVAEGSSFRAYCHLPVEGPSGSGQEKALRLTATAPLYYAFSWIAENGKESSAMVRSRPQVNMTAPNLADVGCGRKPYYSSGPCKLTVRCKVFFTLENGEQATSDAENAIYEVTSRRSTAGDSAAEAEERIVVLLGAQVRLGLCGDAGTAIAGSVDWFFKGSDQCTERQLNESSRPPFRGGALTIDYADQSHAGVYRCTARHHRRSVQLTVKPAIEASQSSIREGESVALACNPASAAGEATYHWTVQASSGVASQGGGINSSTWTASAIRLESERIVTLDTSASQPSCRSAYTLRVTCLSRSTTSSGIDVYHQGHRDIAVQCEPSVQRSLAPALFDETRIYKAELGRELELCCCVSEHGYGTWAIEEPGRPVVNANGAVLIYEVPNIASYAGLDLRVSCHLPNGRIASASVVFTRRGRTTTTTTGHTATAAVRGQRPGSRDPQAPVGVFLFTCSNSSRSVGQLTASIHVRRSAAVHGLQIAPQWSSISSGAASRAVGVHAFAAKVSMNQSSAARIDTVNISVVSSVEERQAVRPKKLKGSQGLFFVVVTFQRGACPVTSVDELERSARLNKGFVFAGRAPTGLSCLQHRSRDVWYWSTAVIYNGSACSLGKVLRSNIARMTCLPVIVNVDITKAS